jgi:hypothetical protein
LIEHDAHHQIEDEDAEAEHEDVEEDVEAEHEDVEEDVEEDVDDEDYHWHGRCSRTACPVRSLIGFRGPCGSWSYIKRAAEDSNAAASGLQ